MQRATVKNSQNRRTGHYSTDAAVQRTGGSRRPCGTAHNGSSSSSSSSSSAVIVVVGVDVAAATAAGSLVLVVLVVVTRPRCGGDRQARSHELATRGASVQSGLGTRESARVALAGTGGNALQEGRQEEGHREVYDVNADRQSLAPGAVIPSVRSGNSYATRCRSEPIYPAESMLFDGHAGCGSFRPAGRMRIGARFRHGTGAYCGMPTSAGARPLSGHDRSYIHQVKNEQSQPCDQRSCRCTAACDAIESGRPQARRRRRGDRRFRSESFFPTAPSSRRATSLPRSRSRSGRRRRSGASSLSATSACSNPTSTGAWTSTATWR